jgi:hypothetical protein
MIYHPDFRKSAVRRRAQTALTFVLAFVSSNKPKPLAQVLLAKHMGQAQTPVFKWLKKQLLIVCNNRWNMATGQCKTYVSNPAGIAYIKGLLNIDPTDPRLESQYVIEQLTQTWAPVLARNEIIYNDSSNRLWHPLQQVRRQYKHPFFAGQGLQFHYDIETAAPRLLVQRARETDPNCKWFDTIEEYINNKEHIRTRIATDCQITDNTVKRIINALLCGARLVQRFDSSIYEMLAHDQARMIWFQQDPWVQQFRTDVTRLWRTIFANEPRTYTIIRSGRLAGVQRAQPWTTKQKWTIYFQEERAVLNAVESYMKKHNIRYFLEHDGWYADHAIDRDQLRAHIESRTRRRVQIGEQILHLI